MQWRSKGSPTNEYLESVVHVHTICGLQNVERMTVSLSNYFHSPNICLSLLTCFTALAFKQTLAAASAPFILVDALSAFIFCLTQRACPCYKRKAVMSRKGFL